MMPGEGLTKKEQHEMAESNFLIVRDSFKNDPLEFNLSYHKPFRFYRENTVQNAKMLIVKEADDIRFNCWLKKQPEKRLDNNIMREIFDAMDREDRAI